VITKPRESAALLVCLGTVFLLPPIGLIFVRAYRIVDIPAPVLYVFGAWIVLVAGAFVISRVLPDGPG
jgi:hypothetical protein